MREVQRIRRRLAKFFRANVIRCCACHSISGTIMLI